MAMAAYDYTQSRDQRQQAIDQNAEWIRQRAENVGFHQQSTIEAARLLLGLLSRQKEFVEAETERCSAALNDLLRLHPQYMSFSVLDWRGLARCGAGPVPAPNVVAQQRWFRRSLESREFVIGEFQIDRFSGRLQQIFALPFESSAGGEVLILAAVVDVSWLKRSLDPKS